MVIICEEIEMDVELFLKLVGLGMNFASCAFPCFSGVIFVLS